ncbi:RnfABCDGE type electron transport complex subunit B [Kallipyga massiliensis]|uniref:RnfABCDGE type electron transport complex subunit B n=1 Tax=Kallipyga massiliensis TaxID=1472764 RepID=UPI0004B1AB1B|nr:RnfABCDGE type electron transport complex subunit B [Kallipyga massiliensis]
MDQLIQPVIIMSILGALFAIMLGVVSKLTYIEVDPKITQVREALPGANCGACGYPGCDNMAEAIATGKAPVNGCPVGGEKSAAAIAAIMGTDASASQRMVASVLCQGDKDHTRELFDYSGVDDCRVMTKSYGGCKSCLYGCLGCRTCQKVCDYGAIKMVNGLATIDQEKCVACMKCINTCPKHIINLVPYHAPALVKCSNPEFGKPVSGNCSIGCIGCSLCTRQAPEEFVMEGKLARPSFHEGYDMEKAQTAADKCPGKCIVLDPHPDVNAVIPEDESEVEVASK